uniref:Uncharacterized protein n=1 Tax=Anguilla anguilla TaxID=7936 RepID=A0A0E9RYC2_ANGAN
MTPRFLAVGFGLDESGPRSISIWALAWSGPNSITSDFLSLRWRKLSDIQLLMSARQL